jgi:hypothetical protein
VNSLPDSIPIHIKEALTSCSIPDAVLYDYDSEQDTHHYIFVEVKYCRDTDPAQQRDRPLSRQPAVSAAERDHSKVQAFQRYAPQATVDQVTLMLAGVSGAIYNSSIQALKDKLGVTQPRLNIHPSPKAAPQVAVTSLSPSGTNEGPSKSVDPYQRMQKELTIRP